VEEGFTGFRVSDAALRAREEQLALVKARDVAARKIQAWYPVVAAERRRVERKAKWVRALPSGLGLCVGGLWHCKHAWRAQQRLVFAGQIQPYDTNTHTHT
jgi:hypothetical protein